MEPGSKLSKILIGLRAAALVLSIIGAVGLGWASTLEHEISTDGLGITFDQMGYVTFAISGMWCLIVLVLHFALGRPVHPGVFVGIDVTLFAYLLSIGIVTASSPIIGVDRITCYGPHKSPVCREEQDRVYNFRIVGTAFLLFNSLVHLAAMIPAAMQCHRQRREKRNNDIEMKP